MLKAITNTASSSNLPNTVVLRDANGNAVATNFISGSTGNTATGTITLTSASTRVQIFSSGSGSAIVKMPDATTLTVGATYELNNNASGNLTIQDASAGALFTMLPGSYSRVILTSNGFTAGQWDHHWLLPSSAAYGTSGLTVTGSLATSGANTWTTAQRGALYTLTDASTIAVDFSLANNYQVVLGGNRTLGVPTNMVAGQTGFLSVHQDGTGSRTLAYSWVYQFPGATSPTLSTGKYTFDQLYYAVNNYATSNVTMTIATPCVVTWTGHGLISGQILQLTTTGALPTGLSASTTYWVNVVDANTFNLSSSLANLQAGTFIATSGSQSGVQTAVSTSITISSNLGIA